MKDGAFGELLLLKATSVAFGFYFWFNMEKKPASANRCSHQLRIKSEAYVSCNVYHIAWYSPTYLLGSIKQRKKKRIKSLSIFSFSRGMPIDRIQFSVKCKTLSTNESLVIFLKMDTMWFKIQTQIKFQKTVSHICVIWMRTKCRVNVCVYFLLSWIKSNVIFNHWNESERYNCFQYNWMKGSWAQSSCHLRGQQNVLQHLNKTFIYNANHWKLNLSRRQLM